MGLVDRLAKELKSSTVLGLDTSILIYHFEAHPDYLPLTQEILSWVFNGQKRAVTSVVTLMEINVRPFQLGREDIARKYEALLANFPNLAIVDIDREVARKAARLRSEYQIRTPDAIQIAACIVNGAEAFITNDRQLERLTSVIRVVTLDRLL